MRSRSSTPACTASRTNARWITASARVSRNKKKSWRQDSSCPRSMRSKRSGRSVAGGATSTPITLKPPSCGSSLLPRLPEIPVTTTVCFSSPILFGTGWRSLHRRLRARIVLRARFRRRCVGKVFLVQLRRGRLLNLLQRILHALRSHRGRDFSLHFVQGQSVFFSCFVHQVSVGTADQLRGLSGLQVENCRLIRWKAGAPYFAQLGGRLAFHFRRGNGLVLQFFEVFSRRSPRSQRVRQFFHGVFRFLLLFLGRVVRRLVPAFHHLLAARYEDSLQVDLLKLLAMAVVISLNLFVGDVAGLILQALAELLGEHSDARHPHQFLKLRSLVQTHLVRLVHHHQRHAVLGRQLLARGWGNGRRHRIHQLLKLGARHYRLAIRCFGGRRLVA